MSTVKLLSGWTGRSTLRHVPWTAGQRRGRCTRQQSRCRERLFLEPLEDRTVPSPVILDPNLGVRTVVGGLTQPTDMAFVGQNDFFVLEKTTGVVQHVINGVIDPTRFDFGTGQTIPNLPVNFASERGLLGIALSPNFANDHDAYLYWTQSSTGALSNVTGEVPVLGNRVDRFIWTPATSTFSFDRNIITLRSFQNDGNGGNPTQMQGNHNGGVLRFGPDGKLYIVIGDNGRRGWMQNLINGPQGPGQTDENNGDVRGGPAPDDAHLTGVLLRLNPDGSIPGDNPFVDIRTTLQAPVLSGANTSGIGSFTLFLNQAMDTFSVYATFQDLSAPTVAGEIRLGGPDGPVIFNMPGFPKGLTSGEARATLTKANFVADPPEGINTLADAVNAVLNGEAYFSIHTTQFPTAAVSGQIQQLDPEITTNLHKVFAYGIRNTFGYTFDPFTGKLWLEENGDQSFDKISIVSPGSNNGWIQSSGPLFNFDGTPDETALHEFKKIEVSVNGLQQTRWPPSNIADTVEEAFNRLVLLPGAHYNPPVFSLRGETPPAGLGFLDSSALGPQYQGALFEGEARDNNGGPFSDPREQFNGALFVFHPNADRTGLDFGGDPNIRPSDGVFLNNTPFDLMGDTSFLLGTNFGVLTDVQTGPDGNLYVVSLSGGVNISNGGAVYEIFRQDGAAPFHSTNLVSDIADPPGGAPEAIDPNLQNPWGISLSGTSPFWLANQGTGTSTLYSGDVTQPDGSISPIVVSSTVVHIPQITGTVANTDTTQFLLSNGNYAHFIFAGLDGSITGWNTGSTGEQEVNVPGAVYTGLAIGTTGAGSFLYAADVLGGHIDVFDTHYQQVTPGPVDFVFSDPNLPAGLTPYRPFNVQNLNGTLYVTYRNSADPEHGGIVDAFDTDGHFLRRVVSGGVNAPWGLALAPDGFGNFGGDLLVGNFGFGDGKINAYDPGTGQFEGYITDANGEPFAVEGLWGLSLGNGGSGGDPFALYFAAGINRAGPGSFLASDGLFGSIRFGAAPEHAGGGNGEAPGLLPSAVTGDMLAAALGPTPLEPFAVVAPAAPQASTPTLSSGSASTETSNQVPGSAPETGQAPGSHPASGAESDLGTSSSPLDSVLPNEIR